MPSPEEEVRDEPPDQGSRDREQHPQVDRDRLHPHDDVVRAEEEPCQGESGEPEGDGAEAAQSTGQNGKDEELGVGIPPEESAETRRPRRDGDFRRAHSPSSYFGASDSSISSSTPKKNACEQSVPQNALPPIGQHFANRLVDSAARQRVGNSVLNLRNVRQTATGNIAGFCYHPPLRGRCSSGWSEQALISPCTGFKSHRHQPRQVGWAQGVRRGARLRGGLGVWGRTVAIQSPRRIAPRPLGLPDRRRAWQRSPGRSRRRL